MGGRKEEAGKGSKESEEHLKSNGSKIKTDQKECKSENTNLKQETAFPELHPGFEAAGCVTVAWVAVAAPCWAGRV